MPSRQVEVDYDSCLAALRAGNQPTISKPTPYGEITCKLLDVIDGGNGGIVAEVCTAELTPQVHGHLHMLVQTAYRTGLSLVMLLYPGGGFNLTLKQLPSTQVAWSWSYN